MAVSGSPNHHVTSKRLAWVVKRDPQVSYRDKSLIAEPFVCHPGLGCQRPSKMSISFPADAGQYRVFLAGTEAKEVPNACTRFAPWVASGRLRYAPAPIAHAHSPSKPAIPFRDGAIIFTNPIVPHPGLYVGCDLLQSRGHGDPPTASCQTFKSAFERCKAFRSPANCLPRKGEAQEVTLP